MFIAKKALTESTRQGTVQHPAGAVLARWLDWPYRVRKALLSCEWVEEIPDVAPPEAPVVQQQVAKEHIAPLADAFICELCPGRTFDTLRGLKKHRHMAHASK